MNQEEQTRKLIRLKRHETPREGYFEDFLDEFRDRHRRESLSQRQPVVAGIFKRSLGGAHAWVWGGLWCRIGDAGVVAQRAR